jgi:hypothetical protein
MDHTIGIQYFLTVPNGTYQFYVTTVDKAGHESIPSNTVSADVTVGIQPGTGDISMLKFGPNPFTDLLNIDLRTEAQTSLKILVYDMSGTLVYTFGNQQISSGVHHFTWNGRTSAGNNLPSGIYSLDIRSSAGTHKTYRLVKLR